MLMQRRTSFRRSGIDPELTQPRQGGSSPDAAKIEAAYVGFHTTLHNRLKRVDTIARTISTVVETDNLLDRQIWLDSIPKMRLWIGDKTLSMLRGESLPVITRPHEASITVSKHDILNDRYGMYRDRINSMGDAYNWALDEMVLVMLCAGLQGTALGATYDGQNLIDTDHTTMAIGGTAQSNLVPGAFSAAVFQTAWNRYLGMTDENGTPLNLMGRRMKLIHGPANRNAVRTVLNQQMVAGSNNLDLGMADPVLVNWIAPATRTVLGVSVTLTGTEWFLMPEGSTAVLTHIKRTPEFLSVEEGEHAFRTGKYLYGIEAEFGAAYGLWQEIVGGPGV